MASSRKDEREEERRFNLRTLVIASSASATAAVVTSQLWIAGTWIAAALTPVLVALVSELLHRPTEKIAERLTTDRPPRQTERDPSPRAPEPDAAPIRVYRSGSPPPRRRRIAVGAVLGTGALALVIAVVALTVPELIAGGAVGSSDSRTTFFQRDRERSSSEKDQQRQAPSESTRESPSATVTPSEPQTGEQTTTEPTATEPPPTTTTTPPTSTTPAPAPAPSEQP